MIINPLNRLLQVIVLCALQVLLMNHIHFMGYGTPLVFVAFLFYLPANANRSVALLWAFLVGLVMDMFTSTPGIAAASMTLAAMFRPTLLQVSMPKDSLEDMVPSYETMGRWNHLRFITVLIFIHHVAYFLIEAFSFFNLAELCLQFASSFATTWLALALLETLRGKKRRERF